MHIGLNWSYTYIRQFRSDYKIVMGNSSGLMECVLQKLPKIRLHRLAYEAIAVAEKKVIMVMPTHSKLFPIPTGGLSGV